MKKLTASLPDDINTQINIIKETTEESYSDIIRRLITEGLKAEKE